MFTYIIAILVVLSIGVIAEEYTLYLKERLSKRQEIDYRFKFISEKSGIHIDDIESVYSQSMKPSEDCSFEELLWLFHGYVSESNIDWVKMESIENSYNNHYENYISNQ
ncbi:hypothetical protein LRP52_29260 [Photobacterium sp. ZSDE20]|uniref:Uncharacterized protein n=1 Tax=Photobacterium pectinilyticum TaxID=2906793 RepID=A0ABT1N850_9GAMM|nr:hypothetical protein [Photobacterium sp. ZSDE20]MCQ1060282.1 hypothetical protein [Photobacterium sp. ZSDE20]MDD1826269.1 hypothetical protein [Photobacterium sp. ZSDE20]